MQLAEQLKRLRGIAGISQEELASRVYVSRQTISNWECAKTYPDVESLLRPSQVLDVSIDELIKGDADEIRALVERDTRLLNRLGGGMLAGLVLFTVSMIWFEWQDAQGWDFAQTVPTMILVGIFAVVTIGCALMAERIKKKHDLVTYREISDFMDGKAPDRGTEVDDKARRHTKLRGVLMFLAAALIGMLVFEVALALLGLN